MIRCPRCRGPMDDQDGIYCEDCWAFIETDNEQGYTAGPGETSSETEDDLPDLYEDDY